MPKLRCKDEVGGMTMAKKSDSKQRRTCGECIHEFACGMWNRGNFHNTDATNCANYETVQMSAAYLIGKMDGERKDNG